MLPCIRRFFVIKPRIQPWPPVMTILSLEDSYWDSLSRELVNAMNHTTTVFSLLSCLLSCLLCLGDKGWSMKKCVHCTCELPVWIALMNLDSVAGAWEAASGLQSNHGSLSVKNSI